MVDEPKVHERKTVPEGEYIFKEGTDGTCAYVVESGKIEIIKTRGDQETVLGTASAGAIFGEMALIDDRPRMASARVAEGATVIVITRAMFEDKLNKADPFIRGLLNILSDHVRSLGDKAA